MASAFPQDVTVLETMTLDSFRMWVPSALKVFLSVRGKPTMGTADELAAKFVNRYDSYI